MKRLSLLVITSFLLLQQYAKAQTEYRPFRVDAGSGFNFALVDRGVGIGYIIIEPKYSVIQPLNVGIKFEGNLIEGKKKYSINHWMSSYLATADYYLRQNSDLRTFVGGGFGIYRIDAFSDLGPQPDITIGGVKNNFGAMLRVGFDNNHFRLALAYNYAGKDVARYDASYLSLSIGGYFGGGKKKITL